MRQIFRSAMIVLPIGFLLVLGACQPTASNGPDDPSNTTHNTPPTPK
jgi:hypothetical protein